MRNVNIQALKPRCFHENLQIFCVACRKVSQFFTVCLFRRADREPSQHSKVCSCLFRDGLKSAGPEIFERNAHKLFPTQENPTRKKRKLDSKLAASAFCDLATTTQGENLTEQMRNESISTEQVILEAELELTTVNKSCYIFSLRD